MKLLVHGRARQRPQHIGTNYNWGSGFVGSGANWNQVVSVNLPAGAVGDLLVALTAIAVPYNQGGSFFAGGSTPSTTSPPWNDAVGAATGIFSVTGRNSGSGDSVWFAVRARIADGTESGVVPLGMAWTGSGSPSGFSPLYGEVKRLRPGRAANLSAAIPARWGFGGDNSGSQAPVAPAVNPPNPIGRLLCWYFVADITSGTMLGSPPSGFNIRSQTSAGTPALGVLSADADWPGPSAPGPQPLDTVTPYTPITGYELGATLLVV